MSAAPPQPESGADLLDHLLGSLLDDFRGWFARGEVLLDLCPESVMAAEQREQFRAELQEAGRALIAASALRQATPAPMALSLETMAPWHQLVMRVWSLSARLRALQLPLPQLEWPEPPAFPG
ncbi:MAG: DUF2605 domain-containing protein [Cyanobacteria bacterium]|nr:DUF2605 domain-containing protein [Cyanobacteriota bacterium]